MDEPFKLKEINQENCKIMAEEIGKFVLKKMYIEPMIEREKAPTIDEMKHILNAQLFMIENLLTNSILNTLFNVESENQAHTIGEIFGVLQQRVLSNVSEIMISRKTGKPAEGASIIAEKEFDKEEKQ